MQIFMEFFIFPGTPRIQNPDTNQKISKQVLLDSQFQELSKKLQKKRFKRFGHFSYSNH